MITYFHEFTPTELKQSQRMGPASELALFRGILFGISPESPNIGWFIGCTFPTTETNLDCIKIAKSITDLEEYRL